jgi:hypothetical protein
MPTSPYRPLDGTVLQLQPPRRRKSGRADWRKEADELRRRLLNTAPIEVPNTELGFAGTRICKIARRGPILLEGAPLDPPAPLAAKRLIARLGRQPDGTHESEFASESFQLRFSPIVRIAREPERVHESEFAGRIRAQY